MFLNIKPKMIGPTGLCRRSFLGLAAGYRVVCSAIILVLGCSQVMAQEEMYEEVAALLDQGYMPDAIYNDQLSHGNPIYAIVEAAAAYDADREAEFRLLAEYLLQGNLPRTACGGNYHEDTDWRTIGIEELEDFTVEEVARLYFEDDTQLTRFNENHNHGDFPVSEVAELLKSSNQWYDVLPVRSHPVQDAIFVSLYKETEEVSVDGNLGKIKRGPWLREWNQFLWFFTTIPLMLSRSAASTVTT